MSGQRIRVTSDRGTGWHRYCGAAGTVVAMHAGAALHHVGAPLVEFSRARRRARARERERTFTSPIAVSLPAFCGALLSTYDGDHWCGSRFDGPVIRNSARNLCFCLSSTP